MAALDVYSAEIWNRIDAMTAEEYEESVKDLKDEVGNSVVYADATDGEDISSIVGRYLIFYETVFKPDAVM